MFKEFNARNKKGWQNKAKEIVIVETIVRFPQNSIGSKNGLTDEAVFGTKCTTF